eukprot:12249581-Alexandrium_andersonii.AAC.2
MSSPLPGFHHPYVPHPCAYSALNCPVRADRNVAAIALATESATGGSTHDPCVRSGGSSCLPLVGLERHWV